MRAAVSSWAASALLVVSLLAPGRAEAQAVAFQPGIGTIPDGVGLNVTPVVSADRRYVRLSLGANFSTINGFMNFPVAAGVSGGGVSGAGLGAILGGAGGGRGGAGAGAGGGGAFRNVRPGPDLADARIPFSPEYLEASRQAAAQAKLEKAKPLNRGKKTLADPVVVPMKKSEKVGPRG
jgi:hypothetical protein